MTKPENKKEDPEARLRELKLRVWKYHAKMLLKNHFLGRSYLGDIPESFLEEHRGRLAKAVRELTHAGVIDRSGRVLDELFLTEAPQYARLSLKDFKMDMISLFENVKSNIQVIKDIGECDIDALSVRNLLWAFFNKEKVTIKKKYVRNRNGTYVSLKGTEQECLRLRLLCYLFNEIQRDPTKNLAEYCDVPWVGKMGSVVYTPHHDKKSILSNPVNIFKAQVGIKKNIHYLTKYSDMLGEIWEKLKGKDQVTETESFVKFVIDRMKNQAPIRLHSDPLRYRRDGLDRQTEYDPDVYMYILANHSDYTFESLFPDGISKETLDKIIDTVSKRI